MTDKELLEREEYLEDILDALEDNDYEEAEDLADEAIDKFPNEAFGYYYLGEAIFLQGDIDNALDYYHQAIEKAPDNLDYKARLALMYAKLNDEEKAKQIYKSILALNDKHVDTLVALGVYAINDEEATAALDYLNKAIEAAPDYGDAYKIRAIIYTTINEYDKALKDVDKALSILPNDTELWLQKINLHDGKGDAKGTAAAFKSWVDLAPKDTDRQAAYANFWVQQGNHKAAEEAFSKAIEMEIYGEYAAINSFLGRGWARLNQNKIKEAIADFNKVIELDAKLPDAYIGIAEARVKEGSVEAASTYLDIGLDIVTDGRWNLLNKKGIIHVNAKNWKQAEAAFQEMIDMDDEEVQAEGHFSMGKLHQAQGNLEAAFRSWRKASDIFHLEAEACIEKYCQAFFAAELKEKETAILGNMQADFDNNKKSKILANFFGKVWKVDIKTTSSKNEMFAQMPAKMEKQIMGLLENICLGIVAQGVVVLNPGQESVRMVYNIKEENAKAVTINGTPLNGTMKREFTLTPAGNHLILRGFGDEDADIDLYMEAVASDKLTKPAKDDFKKLADKGELDFMGEEFKKII